MVKRDKRSEGYDYMALNGAIYVVIVPPGTVEADLVERVAVIINKDLNGTRRVLFSKVPRIASQCNSAQEAELALHNLETLGLRAFSYSDLELRKPLTLFKAHSLEFGQKEIFFRDKAGRETRIEAGNVFLLIKATLETHREVEAINVKKKINLTATLLTGGLPIRRTVREKTVETTVQIDNFLRLFEKPPAEICVEIDPHGFNFSCLGPGMTLSSVINFNSLIKRIRDTCREAFFDDRVRESSGVTIPYVSHMEDLDVSCKLILKYYQVFGCR
jgi:hypothetical protein